MAADIPGLGGTQWGVDKKPLERMREALQVLIGTRGDPLDAALTLRSAIERGLIDRIGNAMTGGVTYSNTFPGYTFIGAPPYSPDLTPPPTVTGLSVVAGFTQVIIQVDAPSYTQGHGNLQTNIYAVKKAVGDSTMPTFVAGTTPRVFSMPGPLTICSLPSELNTRWHVWAKYESVDGVESTSAAGGANGFNVAGAYPTTGQDVSQLLGVLAGQITTTQLYGDLNKRIDLIEPATYNTARLDADITTLANTLTTLSVKADQVDRTMRDAGITVDPQSGIVRINALEQTANTLSQVQITLNAQASTITTLASSTSVTAW